MDIKSLLSPSEPAAAVQNGSSQAGRAGRKSGKTSAHKRKSTSLVNAIQDRLSRVPQQHQNGLPHPSAPLQGHDQDVQSLSDSRSTQPFPAVQHRPAFAHRLSLNQLTSGSENPQHTLAPVQHQSLPGTPADVLLNPSPRRPLIAPSNIRSLSNRSLASVTMDSQTPVPRTLVSDALSTADLSTVTSHLNYLNEKPYAYDYHVQLVNLLHKGFAVHCSSNGADAANSYSLLDQLRQAREAMDSRFAVGEALLIDWLRDEILLVQSSEDRLTLLELMQKAIQNEPSSVDLWQIYIDWIEECYRACHEVSNVDVTRWSAEDREVCRELFTHQLLLDTLEQAAKSVSWRIDASHVIWKKYLSSLQQPARLSSASRGQEDDHAFILPDPELEKIFAARLQVPHRDADETFELFIPVVSRIYHDRPDTAIARYEKVMDRAQRQLKARDAHESSIRYSIDTNDQQGLYQAFEQYISWDRKQKRGDNQKELRGALYERALLHFSTNADWWTAYIDYVISQQTSTHNPSSSVLPLIERATQHCPWSGELWARRILRSDYERLSHEDIEATKHRATNSGLLDIGGMDDLLKVLVEWCSYLRRHAFTATATEDDLDTADVGMLMALEDVQQAGKKLYGEDFQGDPMYRIEKIQIKFFSQARRMGDARQVWRSLIPTKKDSYDFWQQYYIWEITLWIHDRVNEQHRVETTETTPALATAVMQEAIAQHNLDWPEKVHELYVNHFQWHESVENVQAATLVAWAFQQKIAAKRAREAAALATAQQLPADVELPDVETQAETITQDKRKREDESQEHNANKKAKLEIASQTDRQASVDSQPKRDREHLSVSVAGLSLDTTELDLRKFFRDCGEILSLNMATDLDAQTAAAVVEFSSAEEVKAAKTRTGKSLHGREVTVRAGTNSTLYVANFPPDYDEAAVRKLFDSYGEIVSVRFPSLKYNNRRRFCYVTFTSTEQAKAAEHAMDNKMLDGQHKLLAKLSDPDAKKQRSGPQAEGRELFVKNLDFHASEDDVRAYFSQQGEVASINMLKDATGRRLGTCFIVYKEANEAETAISELDKKPFRDRILHVVLSQSKGGVAPADKAKKADIIVKHTDGERRGSDVSMTGTTIENNGDPYTNTRDRQAALLRLPDTVSDARISAEMSKHGAIVKIQLRREQNAAIVEFEDASVAMRVRQGVDCTALGPDTKTAEVKEIFAKKSRSKVAGGNAMMPSQLSRSAGAGRRGGLGFKRGGLGSSHSQRPAVAQPAANGSARSNADFKSMFIKSSKADGES